MKNQEMTVKQLEVACREYVRLYFPHKDADEIITHTFTGTEGGIEAWRLTASKLLGRDLVPMEGKPPHTYSFPRWVYQCRELLGTYFKMQAIQNALMSE